MKRKVLASVLTIIIALSIATWIFHIQFTELQAKNKRLQYQVDRLQNQNSILQDQVSELQNQLTDLQNILDSTIDVEITGFKWIGDFNPLVCITISYSVNFTIRNTGSKDVSRLTLASRLFYKKSPPESVGYASRPIEISPLFELSEALLPVSEEKIRLLLHLLKHPTGVRTVTEMIHSSVIDKFRAQQKASRTSLEKDPGRTPPQIVAKYSYYVGLLQKEKLVREEHHRFFLTPIGRLIAQLVEVRQEVEMKNFGND